MHVAARCSLSCRCWGAAYLESKLGWQFHQRKYALGPDETGNGEVDAHGIYAVDEELVLFGSACIKYAVPYGPSILIPGAHLLQ
jgi:hypothetical protein